MDPIQIAALIVALTLAAARLLDSARWAWDWLPTKIQPVFPALVAAAPAAVQLLQGVVDPMSLAVGIVGAVGVLVAAIRGALPKEVYDKLDEKSQDALRVARGGKSRLNERGLMTLRAGLVAGAVGWAILFGAAYATSACSAATKAVAKSAVEMAAELLCTDFFSQKQGITVDQARSLYCDHKDILAPFLENALAAQMSAGATVAVRAEDVGTP